MADAQPLSVTSHTESVGESIIIGLTPRDVHQFIKGLVKLNTTLRRQLAAVNQDLAERCGNADNTSTESDVHSPVQATGQPDSYPRADQSLRQPSTLASTLSHTAAPVQVESEVEEIGRVLDVWQERLYNTRLEGEPGAPADPQVNSYLRRELESCRKNYDDLLVLQRNTALRHNTRLEGEPGAPADPQVNSCLRRELERCRKNYDDLLVLHRNTALRNNEQNDDFLRQLTLSSDRTRAAVQERDEARDRASEVQNQVDDLNIRIGRHEENLRKLGQDNAALQQKVESLEIAKQQLTDATNKEKTEIITQLDSLKTKNEDLIGANAEQARIIEKLNEEQAKLTGEITTLKKDLEKAKTEISTLSEQLEDTRKSRDELHSANELLVKKTERLEQELNAAKMRVEHLLSDAKLTSHEEQTNPTATTQLKRKIRELEHKLEEMHKSKAVLQTMLEASKSKEDKIELKNQLEDVRAMLKLSEDLARTRGETIETMKREHSRNVESSETYRTLRQQCEMYKNRLDAVHNDFEKESATVKELSQSIETMKSTIEEITNERDSLRLITMRQRHNLPPVVPMSGSASDANTGNSAGAGAAAAATLPATFAQPLRLEVTADAGSPRARTGTRQSAVQTPTNIRLPASTQPLPVRAVPPMIYRCRYCNAEHPDYDSKFVHEKDCPKSPSDD